MRQTHSQDVFKALAKRIVAGGLAPGEKLEERSLAKQFEVSRTPIREALRQLVGTELAESSPGGGVIVAKIDGGRLAEMFEALGELEALCARLSARRMSEVERQKLRLLNIRVQEAAVAEDFAVFADLNEQFHRMIYWGAHNASIAQITESYRQRLAPFRVPSFDLLAGRVQSSVREHDAIVKTILDADPDGAGQAMRAHVGSSSVNVIEHFEKLRAGMIPEPSAEGKATPPASRPGLRATRDDARVLPTREPR